ncbi:GNAT family N-acetyltransferase [Nocardioides montaniterrae]
MITHVHAPELSRYEIRDDEAVIGLADYGLPDAVHVVLPHVEVDPAYGGRGLATELVRFVLEDIRAQGKLVVARCPFVVAFLRNHAGEYDDIVAGAPR